MKALLLLMVLTSIAALYGSFVHAEVPVASPSTDESDNGSPVTIPNARQYDITAKSNGQQYRLMVYLPPKLDLTKPQPVFYVLDGNYYFGTSCDAAGLNNLSEIIVGIGYPSEDRQEFKRRRTFDLTFPTASPGKKYGGGDDFLKVIEKDIKPFVNKRFQIDPARQALFGHSLGGLMVLRQLFRDPQAYSTYVAASPSIWWDGRAVLRDEEAFSAKARAGELHLRLLITSAGDEQYQGNDAILLAKDRQEGSRMLDNAAELTARLTPLNPANFRVVREMFPNETHPSGSQASLVRALRFALQPTKAD